MTGDFLHHRSNLVCTFVLLDIRHSALAPDLEFMEGLGDAGIAFRIIFTKADKLKAYQIEANVKAYTQKLSELWEEVPPMFVTSAEKNEGRDAILNAIEGNNLSFQKTKTV